MAIYQSKYLSPANTAIDGTLSNLFTCELQGTIITKYNIKIYRYTDGVQIYTTGDINLSPVKYNEDTLSITIPINTVTNGTQYKWSIATFDGITWVTSFMQTFWANATATLTTVIPSPVTSHSYKFISTYTQSNGVPIQYFYYTLKDSNGDLIEQTDLEFSGNISHTFSGLISGKIYLLTCEGLTNNGVKVSSPIYNFSVSYAKPNVNIIPEISQDINTSLVSMKLGSVVQVSGSASGTYSYQQNYETQGNTALLLGTNASYYNVNVTIPAEFTGVYQMSKVGFTNGKLLALSGLSQTYEFGYDNSLGRFYISVGGILGYSDVITLPSIAFLVIIQPTKAFVKINGVLYNIVIS